MTEEFTPKPLLDDDARTRLRSRILALQAYNKGGSTVESATEEVVIDLTKPKRGRPRKATPAATPTPIATYVAATPAPTITGMMLSAAVESSLERFAFHDGVADIFKLSFLSGRNAIWYGEGGYGKSEMATACLRIFDPSVVLWKNQWHMESTISSLLGGYDMTALRDTGEEKYRLVNSVLDSHVHIHEEMLDAPPQTLAGIKTFYTERGAWQGQQFHPSDYLFALALTNKHPEEVRNLGPSEAATMERFPMRLHIGWTNTGSSSRNELYEKVYAEVFGNYPASAPLYRFSIADAKKAQSDTAAIKLTKEYLWRKSTFIHELSKTTPLSPRTDIWADRVAQASAYIAGRSEVELSDLKVLRYFVDNINEFDTLYFEAVERAQRVDEDNRTLRQVEDDLYRMKSVVNTTYDPMSLLRRAAEARAEKTRVEDIMVLDENWERKKALADEFTALSEQAVEMAVRYA